MQINSVPLLLLVPSQTVPVRPKLWPIAFAFTLHLLGGAVARWREEGVLHPECPGLLEAGRRRHCRHRVKASRYGLRTRTTDVQAGDYETDWPPLRWDGGVRLVDRSSWRKKRALLKEKEGERAFLIYSYRCAIRSRPLPECGGICEGGSRGRKKEEYTFYREARI